MRTNVLIIPYILDPLLSNRSPHHLPYSKSHHRKPSKNLIFPQINKTAVLPLPLMGSAREGVGERNLNGRNSGIMLTEVWSENSRKWIGSMTKNSKTSPLILTTKNNAMKKPITILMVNQVTLMISSSQWNFKFSKGVMLQFSSLHCTISHTP